MDDRRVSEFTIADLKSVFEQLHAAHWPGILVGGQAVNLYAHFYTSRIPNLESFPPLDLPIRSLNCGWLKLPARTFRPAS